jgi:hypothetical protein
MAGKSIERREGYGYGACMNWQVSEEELVEVF